MPQWTYQLNFKAPFSIFSGLSVAGLVDRMVVRDDQNLPIVPGSTVKGRWRFYAERLLRGLPGGKAETGIWIHPQDQPVCKDGENACSICKWFGSPSIPGALKVGQAKMGDQWRDIFLHLQVASPSAVVQPDTEIRPGVALSRRFRTALPDHLFFDEAVPPLSFKGKILLEREPSPYEKLFLEAAARLVDRLGARKAVGRGLLQDGIRIGGVA